MAELPLLSVILGVCLAILYGLGLFSKTSNPRRLPLPPGPKPEFLIGHAKYLLSGSLWLQYAAWRERFGDIIHLKVPGIHLIALNSYKAAHDLLDLSHKYADRHSFVMVDELMGWEHTTTGHVYGDAWKSHRKLLRPTMSKSAIEKHALSFEKGMRACLLQLLHTPEGFEQHLRLLTGRIIVMFTYGLKIDNSKDQLIVEPETQIARVVDLVLPNQTPLVDIFPFLKYIPSWFPGAAFKRNAKVWKKELADMVAHPFNRVKADMAAGIAVPSLTSKCLEDNPQSENEIMWSAGSMYLAGADTTYAILSTFFLAMATHPEVQKRAQAEIDSVLKAGALPTLADRANLPYIGCLLKELQRWRPVVPLAVPHRLMEDDYYGGYFLPKGSIIFPNAWAISQDEANYKDPTRFWPERFEDPETAELDSYKYAFGWGRRICPGMNLADATIFITVASILATFDIGKPRDKDGNEVEPEASYGPGLVSGPEGFRCTIRPRSDDKVRLIKTGAEELPW